MIRKLSMVALLVMAGWTTTSSAALLNICTSLSGGCGPAFDMNGSGVDITYTYNAGTDEGVLSLSGQVGTASFLEGQLDAAWEANNGSRVNINVLANGGTDDNYALNIYVDGNGNLTSGDFFMNGRITGFVGGINSAYSANNTELIGNLVEGGALSQLGSDNINKINFLGSIGLGSILTQAGYGSTLSGLITVTQSTLSTTSKEIEWNESWTAQGSLGVVVPVPAAVWLFVSGLLGIITFSRKRKSL